MMLFLPCLPDELISKVLLKLPVKSLLRFRCVSKSWRNLIDSPSFINLHLLHTEQNLNSIMFIGKNHTLINNVDPPISLCALDFDIGNSKAEIRCLEPPYRLDCHFTMRTCNGLICSFNGSGCGFVIWNPATHRYRRVAPHRDSNLFYFGFGYDHSTNDYKLVMLEPEGDEEKTTSYFVQVYSMKSDSWGIRSKKDKLRKIFGAPVHVGGILYWVDVSSSRHSNQASNRRRMTDSYRIVGFNLVTGEWLTDPGPVRTNVFMCLFNHRGSLCVASFKRYCYSDFWVMKNEGKNRCWSKLFTVKERLSKIALYFITPVANLKRRINDQHERSNLKRRRMVNNQHDHRVLIHDFNHLMWYDLEKERAEDVDILRGVQVSKAFTCFESLVPV